MKHIMNSLVTIFAILINQALSVESGNNSSTEISLQRTLILAVSTPECSIDPNADKRQCSSDCTKVLGCDGTNAEPLFVVSCPSSLPYCSKGGCVKTRPDQCTVDLNCPGKDALFPDLRDCYKYYICDSNGVSQQSYSCPLYFPFDFKTQTCNQITCSVINCYGKTTATNPNWPSLGVICQDNKPLDATYTACNKNYELDDTLKCQPKCRNYGSFPNYDDPDEQEYYYCLPSGPYGTFELYKSKCTGTKKFDEAKSKCV